MEAQHNNIWSRNRSRHNGSSFATNSCGKPRIDPDKVIVKSADTDASGHDLGVGGGRTTVSIVC